MSTTLAGATPATPPHGGSAAPTGPVAADAPPGPAARPAPHPLPPGHPLAPVEHLGLGDVRLVPVPDVHLGATGLIALVGDPLASIAPLVRLHRLRPPGASGGPWTDDDDLVRAFRRLREDGAGVLVLHRDDRDPVLAGLGDPAHRRAPGVPESSPALERLAASLASIGLRPARLLVPSGPDPEAIDPRVVGLAVVRRVPFGAARPRPSALVGA